MTAGIATITLPAVHACHFATIGVRAVACGRDAAEDVAPVAYHFMTNGVRMGAGVDVTR